ncbi:MAG: heavy-metal-associated domain-containing protein [Actinomycetes bacterium]
MSTVTNDKTTKTTLRSNEFSCPSCVRKIEKQLHRTPGVSAAKVHFTTGRIVVEHDPEVAPVDVLVAAVAKAGYRAAPSAF